MKNNIKTILEKAIGDDRERKDCGRCNGCEMALPCEIASENREYNKAKAELRAKIDDIAEEIVEKVVVMIENNEIVCNDLTANFIINEILRE
jgi:hypothetical protein